MEHANSLGDGRNSPAWIRAIPADSSASSARSRAVERRRDDGVRPLEEVVDDLDLLGSGAEAGERVDETLQRVVGLDDLLRRRVADQVRLVVQDERPRPAVVQDVEKAVQEDAVVLEGEVPFLVDAIERGDPPRELGVAIRRRRSRGS